MSLTNARREALVELAATALALGAWMLLYLRGGIAAAVEARLGPAALLVHVAAQGLPALAVIALVVRFGASSWADLGVRRAPLAETLRWGLAAVALAYLAQPAVVALYVAATGVSSEELLSRKAGWLADFAAVPLAALVPLALFVAVYEEIAFRGFLQSRLLVLFGAPPGTVAREPRALGAITLGAALFAFGHGYQGGLGLVQTFSLGLVFGWVSRRTGSVWAAVAAHAGIDVIGLSAARLLTDRLPEMLGG